MQLTIVISRSWSVVSRTLGVIEMMGCNQYCACADHCWSIVLKLESCNGDTASVAQSASSTTWRPTWILTITRRVQVGGWERVVLQSNAQYCDMLEHDEDKTAHGYEGEEAQRPDNSRAVDDKVAVRQCLRKEQGCEGATYFSASGGGVRVPLARQSTDGLCTP
jgi:hypothetical protein